jgi:hypothetical protein
MQKVTIPVGFSFHMADALYGTREFVDHASGIFKGVQVISQVRANQLTCDLQVIRFRDKNRTVDNYFAAFPERNFDWRFPSIC